MADRVSNLSTESVVDGSPSVRDSTLGVNVIVTAGSIRCSVLSCNVILPFVAPVVSAIQEFILPGG